MGVRFQLFDQRQRGGDAFGSTLHRGDDRFARVVPSQGMPQFAESRDLRAAQFHDLVARLETGRRRWRLHLDQTDFGLVRIVILTFEHHAQQAARQVLAFLPPFQPGHQIGHRHRESNPGIVEFRARQFRLFALRLRRHRHQHAEHSATDINQRPAIIVRRDFRVRLNRLSPDAIDRAEDSDRRVWNRPLERSPNRDTPLAGTHLGDRNDLRHRQLRRRVDLQQHQHAAFVASDDPRRRAFARRQTDQNRCRLLREIEGARHNKAVVGNHESRGRSLADQHVANLFQPADRLNPHNARRDPSHGRAKRLLLQLGHIGLRQRSTRQPQGHHAKR